MSSHMELQEDKNKKGTATRVARRLENRLKELRRKGKAAAAEQEEEQEERQRQEQQWQEEQQRQEQQWQEEQQRQEQQWREQQRQEEERQREEEEQTKSYMKGKWDEKCNVRDEVESNNLKNHLADLNLATKSPTMENLNRAFRTLAMKTHPDKCPDEEKKKCGDKFKQLNNSKATLQGACFNSR